MAPTLRWLIGLALALAGCRREAAEPPQSTPPPHSSQREPGACERAQRERVRAEGLMEAGKLDRSVRVLRYADVTCPSNAAASRALLREALAALENTRGEDADALVERGLAQLKRGHRAEAQRAFDRAMVVLERRFDEPVRIEASNGYGPVGALPWRANGLLHYRNTRALGPAVALSPDGAQLAVNDGPQIVLLDRSFHERMRLLGHASEVNSVAFSADGRRLLSGAYDRTVRVWDLGTGDTELEVSVDDPVREVYWLEGDQAVAASAGYTVSVWAYPGGAAISDVSASAGQVALLPFDVSRFGLAVFGIPEGGAMRIAQLPGGEMVDALAGSEALARTTSGDLVAAYRKGSIELWSWPEQKRRARLSVPAMPDPQLGIYADRLLVAGRSGVLRSWQLPQGEPLPDVSLGDGGWIMGARRDGALVLREGNTVRYVDPRSGRDVERIDFTGEPQPVSVALNGDALLASGPETDNAFTFWRLDGQPLATLGVPHGAAVQTVTLSAESARMVLGFSDKAVVLDAGAGRMSSVQLPPYTEALRLVNGRELVALTKSGISRWDVTGKRPRALAAASLRGRALEVSADGTVALAQLDGELLLWDLKRDLMRSRILAKLRSHATLSRDGRRVAWIDDNGRFQLWSGRVILRGGEAVTALTLSPEGDRLAVAQGGEVHVFDIGRGKQKNRAKDKARGDEPIALRGQTPLALAFAGDKLYVLASDSDEAVHPWLIDLEARTSAVLEDKLDLSFSNVLAIDGDVLALASATQRSVALHDASGRAVAVVRVSNDARTAYVLARSGWLETFGDAASLDRFARCRVGHKSYALSLCGERLVERGHLAHLLRGGKGELPP